MTESSHDPATGEIIERPRNPWVLRSFSQLVAGLEDGTLDNDISEQLEGIVRRLNQSNRNGVKDTAAISLTITLMADRGVIGVHASYKTKTKDPARRLSLMFVDPSGGALSTRNPDQRELPLRTVDDGRPDASAVRTA